MVAVNPLRWLSKRLQPEMDMAAQCQAIKRVIAQEPHTQVRVRFEKPDARYAPMNESARN